MNNLPFDLNSIRSKEDRAPSNYILKNEGLIAAVQMALWLGKPLLLTGAPGTGKTQLAYKIADMLSKSPAVAGQIAPFAEKPFVFNTKTTSGFTDLFYVYDAIRHFQSRYVSQSINGQPASAHSFIRTQALGNAIVQAYGAEAIRKHESLSELAKLAEFDKQIQSAPMSSVVLIDEIDKAPRDFPNDLLNELDNMEFYIQELMNLRVTKPENGTQILILMTSNFEKALPDAFLRRCLFYHIPFPEPNELIDIVTARIEPYLKDVYRNDPNKLMTVAQHLSANTTATITEFIKIRDIIKDKAPTTSELLEWVKTLEKRGFFDQKLDFANLNATQRDQLAQSFPALTKTEADQKRLIESYVRK